MNKEQLVVDEFCANARIRKIGELDVKLALLQNRLLYFRPVVPPRCWCITSNSSRILMPGVKEVFTDLESVVVKEPDFSYRCLFKLRAEGESLLQPHVILTGIPAGRPGHTASYRRFRSAFRYAMSALLEFFSSIMVKAEIYRTGVIAPPPPPWQGWTVEGEEVGIFWNDRWHRIYTEPLVSLGWKGGPKGPFSHLLGIEW